MRRTAHRDNQRGVSLLVVMVVVLLITLLTVWAARVALLNEKLAGNDSDHQRAVEAAHAMVRDAELDIRGERFDGSPCSPYACRAAGASAVFPRSESEFQILHGILVAGSPSCAAGICVSDRVPAQFWADDATLAAMKPLAAAYGAHTGAMTGKSGNPLLSTSGGLHAWYWVEILPYDMSAAIAGGPAEGFAPDSAAPFLYRITAVAQGLKPATQAVIQTTVVWKRLNS